MNVFESLSETSNKATNIGEKYIDTSHQYLKLKVFQQLSSSMSIVVKMLIIGAMIFIALLFLAFSATIALGEYLDNWALGALIVGGSFLMLAVIVYLIRHKIDDAIIETVSHKFFDK